MISAPKNIYGITVFKMLIHELTVKRAAMILDVTERSIWRWLADGKVSKASVLALFWESHYGQSLIESDQRNEIVLLRARVRILEDQFIRAKDVITGMRLLNYGTANEPLCDVNGEFIVRAKTAYATEPEARKVAG